MGNKDHEVVEVFYATDRKAIHEGMESVSTILWRFCPVALLGGGTILCLGIGLQRPSIGIWTAALALGSIAGLWTYVAGSVTNHNARYLAKQGPRYGTERGELRTGVCRVSIPRTHQTGALEAPSILRLELKEDIKKHLVLQAVYPLAEEAFYSRMRARVGNSERRELFIFIHGYNVTFEDAARRTAQMHYDLDYQGAPIFYSWPSQGELFKYTFDETNIAWTTSHFKKFVLDVAAKSDARSINLIAHSMGNRALTTALKDISKELQGDQKVFNQVVLAAPDIDAEIFKNDIAPAIQATCENITLYASSHDQALIASKLVHGYPRAGESGANLIVIPGIDTIDVSAVETNFLGHSYYGDSDVILADVCNLLTESKPPERRGWLTAASAGTMTYWVFQGARAATSMPRTLRR
jgi:esterase/lipase superfamily enzyme